MNTIYRYAAVLGRVVKSRLFGAAALAVASAVLVMSVSVNMHAITVIDGENSKVVFTMNNDDPHAVLTAAGVALSEGDEVRSDIENIRGEIEINRAFDVQITADGISTVVRMTGGTVNDVLERTGIEVREDDMLSHLPETTVTDGMNITVERVGYNEYTRTEAIPYETTLKYTNVIPKGSTKLKQAGKRAKRPMSIGSVLWTARWWKPSWSAKLSLKSRLMPLSWWGLWWERRSPRPPSISSWMRPDSR